SRRAVTGVSATMVTGDFGSIPPAFTAWAYCGIRMTPWESCPRRFASTSRWAIQAASPAGAPSLSKMRVAVVSRWVAVIVGMHDTIPQLRGLIGAFHYWTLPEDDMTRCGTSGHNPCPGGQTLVT